MAESNVQTSRRNGFTERLKKKYPNKEWPDDEALFGQISDDYDEYDNELNGYKEREGKLTDLFKRDPVGAQFLTDMARGEDPFINTIKRLGIDGVTDLLNDPSKQEAYAEANQEYIKKLAKSKELDDLYASNLEKSLETGEQFKKKFGLDDETMDKVYELVFTLTNKVVLGEIDEETMDMALKAVNHDSDVAAANEEGMVAGKNARAEERLRKPKGDGIPNLQGGGSAPQPKPSKKKGIFELAKEAI